MKTRLFEQLLSDLNAPWDKAAQDIPGLRIAYNGTQGIAVIQDDRLYLQVAGGSGAGWEYDLAQYTLSALAADLGTKAGYTVTLLDSTLGPLKAYVLAEGSYSIVPQGDLLAYASALWQVLRPMARALTDAEGDTAEAVKQLAVPTAQGAWLDHWGELYGIRRVAEESDDRYRQRVLKESLYPRCNNKALEAILEAALGVSVSVLDGGGGTFLLLNQLGHVLNDSGYYLGPGYVGALGYFRVQIFGSITPLQQAQAEQLVQKYKAAGTSFTVEIYG